MNVIWIVADTFRQDHVGAYGKMPGIFTPSLDALAGRGVRFNRHYAGGFPTMPTRADHATGRWTASFMTWEPLPDGVSTLAETLAAEGVHTAAMVDTPFYLREGMNYDRGFQTFNMYSGQVGGGTLKTETAHHESEQARYAWRYESDRNVARTMTNAMEWLQLHYEEDFFLYIDTWDPHEPWDAPDYYTKLYMPEYDGELVHPIYGRWHEMPGYSAELVEKAHATYCGEVTMVDTWVGYLLRMVENMGLNDKTAIIFTTDHGFYFGEHGGWFGKLQFAKKPDGSLYQFGESDAIWGFSPLYEELALIPLLISAPGVEAGTYDGLTSVVDVMPTVLDLMGLEAPSWVEGRSLLAKMRDPSLPGRDFTVTTVPFANPGDAVNAVDDRRRRMSHANVTTVTTDEWVLLYSPGDTRSELYNLKSDPGQESNVIAQYPERAEEIHEQLVEFMRETRLAPHMLEYRKRLLI